MKSCSTCCTRAKSFDLTNPKTTPEKRLEFVEHVLGVLNESRCGNGIPYTRLSDQPVTTGDSRLFANVRLLTAAEIEARLEWPLALANGAWLQDRPGFNPTALWAKAREIMGAFSRRLKPTAILLHRASTVFLQPTFLQPTFSQPTNLARGSPTFSAAASPASEMKTRHPISTGCNGFCTKFFLDLPKLYRLADRDPLGAR